MSHPTAERVREAFDYDPETGIFVWKKKIGRKVVVGKVAGSLSKVLGYVLIGMDGSSYGAHRLAWLYMTGEWPAITDHINGVKSDNRFANLRSCNSAENNRNRPIRKDNRAGFKGVKACRNGTYQASITHNRERHYLGTFRTPEEAHSAYCEAAKRMCGEFANFGI